MSFNQCIVDHLIIVTASTDALDNVSGYDREKMLAVLEVLRMSSEDQDNRYMPTSPPPKLSTEIKQKSVDKKKKSSNYRRTKSAYESSPDKDDVVVERSRSVSTLKTSNEKRTEYLNDEPETPQVGRKDKKSSLKKKSFLKEAFSFRRKGNGRLSRLFGSRKKLIDSSLKYLLQNAPQGIVKVHTNRIDGLEKSDVPLLVTVTTTSLEVTKTVLEKLELAVDHNCYSLVQSHSTKSGKLYLLFLRFRGWKMMVRDANCLFLLKIVVFSIDFITLINYSKKQTVGTVNNSDREVRIG